MKRKTKFLIFSFCSIFIVGVVPILLQFYHSNKVLAHEITKEAWILINNEDLLKENTNPKPATLQSYEHYLTRIFKAGDVVTLKIQDSEIKEQENLTEFNTVWDINGSSKTGNEITITLDKEGIYLVKVNLSSSGNIFLEEEFEIFAGSLPEVSNIKIEPEIVGEDKVILITRDDFVKFSVNNPNSNYKYIWDLGDGETKEGASAEKLFESTKMPLYVFLRTVNSSNGLYSDSYIKLDSNQPPVFKVNTPAIINPNSYKDSNNNIAVIMLIIGSVILVIIIVSSYFYVIKRRKGGKI